MTATGLVTAIPPPAIIGKRSQHEYSHAVDSAPDPVTLIAPSPGIAADSEKHT
jgi:hypothetical protein